MSLQSLLDLSISHDQKKIGVSEERVRAILPEARNLIAFYRAYPDIMIDHMIAAENEGKKENEKNKFKFFVYQRIFLRAVMRHRYCYAVFPRAFSKSFLSVLVLMLRAILYPGSNLFISTGGKEQAASITLAKVEELCRLIPALKNELNMARGQTKKSKDDVRYIFKNGSEINILVASERSRGQRRTGGLFEECVLIDQTILNEVLIPTTNVDRLLPDGTRDPKETVNKFQVYITTAGYKQSFAYSKLIEILANSIVEPDEAMILGGTYEIPVKAGLLDSDFVEQLKNSGTYNEDSFDREYRSQWTGDVENAFFSSEVFDKHRTLILSENEAKKKNKDTYYVLGVDVGRLGCTSEIIVFKVNPSTAGGATKNVVNIYTFDADHFEDQAIAIKRLYYKYHALCVAIDANGLGVGLVDYLVKAQSDPETGEELPPFGVMNDEDAVYKKYLTPNAERDALYLIKANAPINTEAYAYAQTQLLNGRIKFLINETEAKTKLMSTKVGQGMTIEQRNTYLYPYIETTILKEQLANLTQTNEGVNIILKQVSKNIRKDKVSAFIYGLYFIKQEEERRKKHKKWSIADLMFFN